MATTAPALLHNMHHLRSSSDTHPHKLHKHKSFSHITFTETGKTEEFRDDLSSQSSSNDAKSDLSRRGSVKRTVKKVKKYFTRRFSGHHPHHHNEENYSIMSGSLVGAQLAYATLGGTVSAPNSPSGNRSRRDLRFVSAEEDHVPSIQTVLDNQYQSPGTLINGDRSLQPIETHEMATQTPDTSFEFDGEDTENIPLRDSFYPVDSGVSVFQDINVTVPKLPPTPVPVQEVQRETEEEEEPAVGIEADCEGNHDTVESSVSANDGMTIVDSIESFRSLDEVPDEKLESEMEVPFNGAGVSECDSHFSNETKESMIDVHTADAVIDPRPSKSDTQDLTDIDVPSKEPDTKPQPPNSYVSYDDGLDDMSFDVFNVPYLKATVVALAASGVGVMLANGVYRFLRA